MSKNALKRKRNFQFSTGIEGEERTRIYFSKLIGLFLQHFNRIYTYKMKKVQTYKIKKWYHVLKGGMDYKKEI
jgi:hypothetical protein